MGQLHHMDRAAATCRICLAGCLWVAVRAIPACTVSKHAGEGTWRTQCRHNLKQIALALANYHDVNGCYPPAYIPDAEGRPMHSWRVLLLPYLEFYGEYKEYRFDEPWNSPDNLEISRSVASRANPYRSPDQRKPWMETNYMMIVGPGTICEGAHSMRVEDVCDDPATTLVIAEVFGTGVHWTEPKDLDVATMSFWVNDPRPDAIRSGHRRRDHINAMGAHVLLADFFYSGTFVVRLLSEDTDPDVVRAMTTIDGGESVPEDVFSSEGQSTLFGR